MKTKAPFIFLLPLFFFAGCVSTKEAAQHPLAGQWDYSVDTPEGVYKGVISVNEVDGKLQGFITSEALSGEMDLNGIEYMEESLSFSFDSGQYGVIDLKVNVAGDEFDGFMTVSGVGDLPVTGSRLTE